MPASSLFGDMDMAKVMLGKDAIHVGFNMIAQPMGDEYVIGPFQTSQGLPLLFGSKRTHVLLLGDMMFRPHLVVASDAFTGEGFSGLARYGFQDVARWAETGDILLGREALTEAVRKERGR